MGYQDGKNDIHSPPVDVQEVFITAYQEGYDSKRWEVVKGSFITRTRALTSTKNSLWNNAVKQEITSSDWRLKINGGFRKEA
ncbi:hypothetical protein ACOI1C_21660, partial [Bacillus sp. DJP31]|uniref:hypothetical protein n=1 Tax=Bacillus sp. DJP31 TaxID=3409789 RepID=UPI003BB54A81